MPLPIKKGGNMLIEYTPQEAEALQQITQDGKRRMTELTDAIDKTEEGSAERKALINERIKIRLQMAAALETLSEKYQKERFKQIAADPEAILDNAREQIPRLLEYEYKELTAISRPADLETIGIADTEGGRFLFKANFMAGLIMDELKLHISALQEDTERLQELFELIIENIEASALTNSEEITLETAREIPVDVMRVRRKPIKDINLYGLMNDKMNAQLIQNDGIFQKAPDGQMRLLWNVNQAPKGSDQVPVYISLTYEGIEKELSKKLNGYDNAVYNAISDLFYYWKRENPQEPLFVTPQEIWRRMNGKQNRDGSAKPSAATVKRIRRSIDKMRHIDFYMDISEEIKAHYITLDDERLVGGYIKDYLLNCTEAGVYTQQGRIAHGYRVNQEPVLYTYNAAKKHVLFLPFDLLDTSGALSDSENVTEFKQYLLQQILLMKNGIRDNTKILMSTIYTATGIKTPEERVEAREYGNETTKQQAIRRKRTSDNEKIEKLLDVWTEKEWIKGYRALNANSKPARKTQTIAAYDILL